MSTFLRQAEEILDTAVAGSQEIAIVIDRKGGLQMLDPTGWSLPAMRIEYGAAAVFKVERRGGAVRVEGWDGTRSCRLETSSSEQRCARFAGLPLHPLPKALPAAA